MTEIYQKQIEELDNLIDIADLVSETPQFSRSVQNYIKNPYDAEIERAGKGLFTLGVSKSEAPTIDNLDDDIILARANETALARLACCGARFLTIKNNDDKRVNALGLFKSKKNIASMAFDSKGDTIYVVGNKNDDSELNLNNNTLEIIQKSVEKDYITSAHYISTNGLFVSLVECCAPNQLGFDITGDAEIEDKEFLFSKSKHIAIITVTEEQENDLVDYMFNNNIPITLLGHVTKGELRLDELSFGHITDFMPI